MEVVPFTIIEHTADIAAVISGRDLAALLTNAAAALYSLVGVDTGSQAAREQVISVESVDDDALLVDWLNELIYLLFVDRLLAGEFIFDVLGEGRVTARCTVHPLPPDTQFKREIKAATYHMSSIAADTGWLIARVVFDV